MGRTSIFQALRMREEAEQAAPVPVVQPYEANYANKLRVVGRHFDRNGHSAVNVMEVPGGMLARVVTVNGLSEELIEFPDEVFPDLYAEAVTPAHDTGASLRIKSELIPTSYEDVLHALGARLDEWLARSIVLAECQPYLFITGQRMENNSVRSRYIDFQEVLYPADVDLLITEPQRERTGLR